MSEQLHQLVLKWPRQGAKVAIVTGTFDQWALTIRMTEDPRGCGFVATVDVPWKSKILYKFFIDGQWTTTDNVPTEADPDGHINHVYYSPEKPEKPVTPRNETAPKPLTPAALTPEKSALPTVPGDDTKPVDIPPKTLSTPPRIAPPLSVVPVNDANTVGDRPPGNPDDLFTHAIPVRMPPATPPSKMGEETGGPKPEEIRQPNGITTNGTPVADNRPTTPVREKIPTVPTTPETPKSSNFPGSTSSTLSPGRTGSRKGSIKHKKDSIIKRIKHVFTHHKDIRG